MDDTPVILWTVEDVELLMGPDIGAVFQGGAHTIKALAERLATIEKCPTCRGDKYTSEFTYDSAAHEPCPDCDTTGLAFENWQGALRAVLAFAELANDPEAHKRVLEASKRVQEGDLKDFTDLDDVISSKLKNDGTCQGYKRGCVSVDLGFETDCPHNGVFQGAQDPACAECVTDIQQALNENTKNKAELRIQELEAEIEELQKETRALRERITEYLAQRTCDVLSRFVQD